ncbi:hypothetical protein CspHIS471_0610360 [Cutaneotrichosporon sp. HIS471]|nr:hypothetical protein CspHIS471_0610360 [Cutaneotrichosporon sp. HIS471]
MTMPTFSSLLQPGAPFPTPTPDAYDSALELILEEEDASCEADLQRGYHSIWSSALGRIAPRRNSPKLSGVATINLAERPGPTMAWRECTVHLDLTSWATSTLPAGEALPLTWGFKFPDLGFLAGSADRRRFLVAASGEIKVPARTSASDTSHRNGPWTAALAQEAIYALSIAEVYGSRLGVIAVGTQLCRLVIRSWAPSSRSLGLEVSPEFHAYLGPGELPLERLVEDIRQFGGRVGALDLRESTGDVDPISLRRLWGLLHAAATSVANQDVEVRQLVSDVVPSMATVEMTAEGESLLRGLHSTRRELRSAASASEAASLSESSSGDDSSDEYRPSPKRRRTARPLTQGRPAPPRRRFSSLTGSPPPMMGPAPAGAGVLSALVNEPSTSTPTEPREFTPSHESHASYVQDWVFAQTGRRIARSRALFPDRVSPAGSDATSDGSLVDPDHLIDMLAALRITVRPMLAEEMDDVLLRGKPSATNVPAANSTMASA